MFGYIRPLECELRVREQKEYRAYYCGLCKSIGRRYGLIARAMLNYDCAFLSAFLSEQAGLTACACEESRCLLRPFKGKQPVCKASALSDYAADVNVLLAWLAICDHWTDDRSFSAWLSRLLLKPVYRKASAYRPELTVDVEKALARLHEIEANRETCSDVPADAFGQLMQAVIRHAPDLPDGDRRAAEWMFYNLGRWIYLIDAWDDREKDKKRGAYNVLNLSQCDGEQAEYLLYISLREAEKAYDLVEMDGLHGLCDNIVHEGCRMMTKQLLEKKQGEQA